MALVIMNQNLATNHMCPSTYPTLLRAGTWPSPCVPHAADQCVFQAGGDPLEHYSVPKSLSGHLFRTLFGAMDLQDG